MKSRRISSIAALLAGVCSALPTTNRAAAQTPTAAPRVLASFAGERNDDESPSPDGRWLFRSVGKQISIYDVARRSSIKIADMPAWGSAWSSRGDAVAFVRGDDDGEGNYIWYVAMDPATGKPRGAPRRVSTGQGQSPGISSDGKFIAYSVRDTGKTFNLSVIPVNGGNEHVVARGFAWFETVYWSADDRFIFLTGVLPASAPFGRVLRVSAAGGTPQVIGPDKVWLAGMTQDRRYLVTVPASNPMKATDRAIVIDTAGRQVGAVPLPVGEINEYAGVIGDSDLVWVQIVDHKTIEVRDANGTTHQLPLIGRSDLFPHWAPDGRRLAFLVQELGRYSLAISGANGESPVIFHDTDVRPGDRAFIWSPDARTIAYEKSDLHSMWLFDVATGKSRRIFSDDSLVPGPIVWRGDNAGVRFLAERVGASGSRSILEISRDGRRRELSKVTGLTGIQFVGDRSVMIRDSASANLLDLETGERSRIAAVDPGTRISVSGVSTDGNIVAALLAGVSPGPRNRVEVLSISQHGRQVQTVPFIIDVSGHVPAFTSNNSLLLFGKNTADSTTKIYEVPLAGGSPRVIADVGAVPGDESVNVSVDGRLAYTTERMPTEYNLLLIDLPAPVRKTASRPARP